MRDERSRREIARSVVRGYDPDPARQPESPVSLIHTSSLPDVEIPEMSITDYVFHKAAAYPDRIAVSDGGGNQYTFAELEAASRRLAGGLAARWIDPAGP